jgi:hypothetical protein
MGGDGDGGWGDWRSGWGGNACATCLGHFVRPASWYNELVDRKHYINTDGVGGEGATALLVGNSALLWSSIRDALSGRFPWSGEGGSEGDECEWEDLRVVGDVIDRYSERAVVWAIAEGMKEVDGDWPTWVDVDVRESVKMSARYGGTGRRCKLHFAHDMRPSHLLSMQKAARATGAFHLCPQHLAIHPIWGPWVAFRAVVVFEDHAPAAPRPADLPCPYDEDGQRAMQAAFEHACTARRGDWRPWLALRDACPLRDHRYPEDMIRYHYTHDPSSLPFPKD